MFRLLSSLLVVLGICLLFAQPEAQAQCAGGMCQMQSGYSFAPTEFAPMASYYQSYPSYPTYYTYEPQLQTYDAYQSSQPVVTAPVRRYTTYRPTFYRPLFRPRFR